MNLTIGHNILRKKDSKVFFALAILICVLVAFFKESIFPEKYFNDAKTIQDIIEKPYLIKIMDSNFVNTAFFFKKLYIDKYIVAPVLAIVSYLSAILFIFKKYQVKFISFPKVLLVVAYSAMAMVYMSTYSKDLVLFLIVIIPFIFFEKKNIFIWTLFAIFYASFFRSYWFITILLFWGFKLFVVKKPKLLLLAIPIYYVLISFIYNYIFGTSLSMIRYLTNIDRDSDIAQTAISTYIKGDNFMVEAANFYLTLVFLIIPIPLLLLGAPFYIILALLIIVFFYNFLLLYVREYNNKNYTNIFSFIISFLLVQSLFEPDYGSFVRHLSPLYPLFFVCIVMNFKKSSKIQL